MSVFPATLNQPRNPFLNLLLLPHTLLLWHARRSSLNKRPRTPPPNALGSSSLPHRPGQEWDTPTIARVRQARSDGISATDVKKELGVPLRSQRDMLKKNPHTDRRPGSNRGRPPKIDLFTVHKMEEHVQGHYKKHTLDWERLGLSLASNPRKLVRVQSREE